MTINNKDNREVTRELPSISATPPFNPPYLTRQLTEQGVQVIEIRSDGSTRVMMENEILQKDCPPPSLRIKQTAKNKQKATEMVSTRPSNFESLPRGNDRAVMFLDVSYSEKDIVKRMGARWDSAMRKWYVPHGLDINLFAGWWPETLKQEMKTFGQL